MKARAKELDDAMMSWQYWAWANKPAYEVVGGSELGDVEAGGRNHGIVYDLTGPRSEHNLHDDRLNALARPYPRAVAGTPLGFSFDPATPEGEKALNMVAGINNKLLELYGPLLERELTQAIAPDAVEAVFRHGHIHAYSRASGP